MFFRSLYFLVSLFGYGLFILCACGKSEDQKKAEENLHQAVMQLHDEIMVQQKTMKEFGHWLSARVNKYSEYPKREEMVTALALIDSAKTSMQAWMKTYRKYDANKPHNEVMQSLNADKNALLKIKADTEKAIQLAQTAYEDHERFLKEYKNKYQRTK